VRLESKPGFTLRLKTSW